MTEKRFYTIAEMAKLTGLSKARIKFETEEGNIPFLKISNGYLFEIEAIRARMAQNAEDQKAFATSESISYKAGQGVDPRRLKTVLL